jgi:acyl-CoA thioester hydrolase
MDEFSIEKRIYYHDTDCGGVVYYANYLKYLEEARTEYLLSKGVDLQKLSGKGIWFVVAKVEIEYKSPARYQDTIRILTRIEKTKYSAMQFFQTIVKNSRTVTEARTTLICVNNDFKPIAIPEEIKNVIIPDA